MTELDILTECDFVRLSDLYDKYKDDIPPSDILYVVVTNGLSGTIYDCGHTKRGIWHIFAKTDGKCVGCIRDERLTNLTVYFINRFCITAKCLLEL